MSHRMGIPTIDINPVESELSHAAKIHLPLPALEAITEIEKRYNNEGK